MLATYIEEPLWGTLWGKKSSNVRSNIFYVKVVFDYYKQRKLFESGDICLFCPILFLKNGFSSWSFLLLQRHGLSLLSTNLLVVVPRWTWFFHSLFIHLNEYFSPLFSVVRTLILRIITVLFRISTLTLTLKEKLILWFFTFHIELCLVLPGSPFYTSQLWM